jgi:hypothetical protein
MSIRRKTIEYAGLADPSTPAEMRIEILGLRNAIRQAKELISRYEQAMEIAAHMGQLAPEEQCGGREAVGQPSEQAGGDSAGPPLVR